LIISLRQAVDAEPDVELCEDESIQLGATDVEGASYLWRGPDNFISEEQFPSIRFGKPRQSGEYAVVGTVSGCATFPATTYVEVHPTPAPDLGPDTVVCTEHTNVITTLVPGEFASYRWQDGSRNASYDVQQEGQFTVTVADQFGCEGITSVQLREQCPTQIFVPNAFSPNDDGYNDTFGPLGHNIISLRMRVYNRWGALLFESSNPELHWDGQINGRPADIGLYVWVMEVEGYRADGSEYSEVLRGTVAIMARRD
ncbi:MAG: gliding motility-associated C-terminal domain-containing protein, partial [Bacteroidota bacterium]